MYTFYNVFPKRVQSLRLSKWACQGGEYHLMFTHDQNRVLQWVLTRCPFDRHASLCLPVQYIDGLHHHPAMIQPHRDDAAYSCLREFHKNRLIQPNFTLELSFKRMLTVRGLCQIREYPLCTAHTLICHRDIACLQRNSMWLHADRWLTFPVCCDELLI